MPIRNEPQTLLRGLSDFWQRFFADSPKLNSLYAGSEILLGQNYLDLLSNVLNVSLLDAPVFNKEYWKLITIREDELSFVKGASTANDRWQFKLPNNIVDVHLLDNKVIEPTTSLQKPQDFSVDSAYVFFKEDPTDTDGLGNPIPGVSFRKTDVVCGGSFTASDVVDWTLTSVKKGNIIRLLDERLDTQVGISDHTIITIRPTVMCVSEDTPFSEAGTNLDFVILRKPHNDQVDLEDLSFISDVADLAHTRLVLGSVKLFAKALDGTDVKENIDYSVDYEAGKIRKLTTWASYSNNNVSYSWLQEVHPSTGTSPRISHTGTVTLTSSVRVTQIALWSPDVSVDRETLYNNFGSLINFKAASSEAYRSFLRGVFQLYMLGPVLSRIESALNVILGFTVIRDDDEMLVSYDDTDPTIQIVTTRRLNGLNAIYTYPPTIPVREDVKDTANIGVLTFKAFEALTTAATVTDYLQDPNWWHNILIPQNIFSTENGASVPDAGRRTITPLHYENIVNPVDRIAIGDPGFLIGADDEGTIPAPGHSVFRKKMAFVLFDRFLKSHIFFVQFDSDVFTLEDDDIAFSVAPDELQKLVFDSRPAYTYIYVQPQTTFTDVAIMSDERYYQPMRYSGADYDADEIRDEGDLLVGHPSILLGLIVSPAVHLLNQGLLADTSIPIGDDWLIGDYASHIDDSVSMAFPTTAAVAIPFTSSFPDRDLSAVRVFINTTKAGKKLVELIDYSVDYENNTISRITSGWLTTSPTVTLVAARTGNISVDAVDTIYGEIEYTVGGNYPKLVRAEYDNSVDLNEDPWQTGNHRDMSIFDRSINISY